MTEPKSIIQRQREADLAKFKAEVKALQAQLTWPRVGPDFSPRLEALKALAKKLGIEPKKELGQGPGPHDVAVIVTPVRWFKR